MSGYSIHIIKKHKKLCAMLSLSMFLLMVSQAMAQSAQPTDPIQSPNVVAEQKPSENVVKDFDAEVKVFNEKAFRFNTTFITTSTKVISLYLEADEATKWQERADSVKLQNDVKLQGELLKSMIPIFSQELQKLTSDSEFTVRTQQLSADSLKQLRASSMGFLFLMIQAKGILDSGKKLSIPLKQNKRI